MNTKLTTRGLSLLSLMAAMALPAQASAQPTTGSDGYDDSVDAGSPSISFDARIRPRGEFRAGRDFGLPAADLRTGAPGFGDFITLQSRLGASATNGALSGRLLLQHAAVWGSAGGGALTQPPLSIAHAYATYEASDMVSVTMGRFALAYGDEVVLGAVGWDQQTRAWDGLKVDITPTDGVDIDVFAARSTDGITNGAARSPSLTFDGDGFLVGAYASLGGLVDPALDTLDIYLIGDLVVEDLTDDEANPHELLTAGARAKGAWSIVEATVEGAYQLGSRCQTGLLGLECTEDTNDISAFFVDAEVGVTVAADHTVRVFVAGSIASGDDPDTDAIESYSHLYPTAHKFLGRTDVVGPRSNVIEGRGGVSLKVGGLTFKETAHYFQRVQPESEHLGVEFDTTLGYTIDDGFSIQAGHGIFLPGPAVSRSSASPDRAHNWFFIQSIAAFGG